MTQTELKTKKLTELKEIARQTGLGGWTALRKQELIDFILNQQISSPLSENGGIPRRSEKFSPIVSAGENLGSRSSENLSSFTFHALLHRSSFRITYERPNNQQLH